MLNQPRFTIRLTHVPSGITATRDAFHFRTERAAYNSAMKYIKSRIYMLGYPPIKEIDLKFEEL